MIDDIALAKLCQATYSKPASIFIQKTGVYICVTEFDDYIVVANRGSVTIKDWVRDLEAWAHKPRRHPQLGYCHAGFLDAAESAVDDIIKYAGVRDIVLAGHSLGGAEAVAEAALLLLKGKAPIKFLTLGAPRVGMWSFVKVLDQIKDGKQFVRGNDPVPGMPYFIPPVFLYRVSRSPTIHIGVDQSVPTDAHHVEGYVQDVTTYLRAS